MRLHCEAAAAGLRRILLVSNSVHLARAVPRFEKVGMRVFPAAADDMHWGTGTPDKRLALMVYALRETAGRRL